MHTIQNLSVITEYDKFSKDRWKDVEELKRSVMDNYVQFTTQMHETSKKYQTLFD